MNNLDLSLAWKRAKLDRPDRCFTIHPRLLDWIALDEAGWIDSVRTELSAGYNPRDAVTCWAPKASGLGRPGKVLDLADELIYNALISAAYPFIWTALRHMQGDPSVANQLQSPERTRWVRRGGRVRTEWRRRSREKAEITRCTWMVSVDIAGFYDNIDHRLLQASLTRVGVPDDVTKSIILCLRRWAQPKNRGIPQGYTASDILANLFLATLDEAFAQHGFACLRYVDDIRIFCSNRVQAKEALALFSKLLFERGLTPQSGKTLIEPRDSALRRIDGVGTIIETVHARLRDDLLVAYGEVGPYGTIAELRELAIAHPQAAPPPVLEEAFREHFDTATDLAFDATLFHFLLNRLGPAKSQVGVDYCLHVLQERPEESEYVLRYFSEVGIGEAARDTVLRYASSSEAVYDYQLYQIGKRFYDTGDTTDGLLDLCRRWAFDRNRAPWLRSYALFLLGRFGTPADLERLEASYSDASTDIERAELIAAIARMPAVRRNSFYSSVHADGPLVERAIRITRG
jgi:hypothetical protein